MSKILLQPLGNFSYDTIIKLKACIEERFIINIYSKPPLKEPVYAYNPQKKQFFSKAILKELKTLYPDEIAFVITLTDLSIYNNSSDYVTSEIYKNIAIISTFNIKSDEKNSPYFQGLLKETCRQTGYLLGLSNCFTEECLMFYKPGITLEQINSILCCNCEQKVKIK